MNIDEVTLKFLQRLYYAFIFLQFHNYMYTLTLKEVHLYSCTYSLRPIIKDILIKEN